MKIELDEGAKKRIAGSLSMSIGVCKIGNEINSEGVTVYTRALCRFCAGLMCLITGECTDDMKYCPLREKKEE